MEKPDEDEFMEPNAPGDEDGDENIIEEKFDNTNVVI